MRKQRIRVLPSVFAILFQEIKHRYEERCLAGGRKITNKKTEAYFGFGRQGKEQEGTLFDEMCRHPAVKQYLQSRRLTPDDFSPKYLYNLSLEVDKWRDPDSVIEMERKYADMFVRFLETPEAETVRFNCFEDFVRSHESVCEEDRPLQLQLLESQPGEVVPELATHYTGYYLASGADTRSFELAIDFINRDGEECPAQLWGFRQGGGNTGSQELFTGRCRLHPSCLSLVLVGEEASAPLTFIIQTDNVPTRKLPVLMSCFHGLTIQGCPFSAEALLVKTKEWGKDLPAPGEEANVEVYLRLQRHYFQLPLRANPPLDQLEARGIFTKTLLAMQNTYRIWNRSERGVVQSRLVITPEFNMYLETPAEGKTDEKIGAPLYVSQIRGNYLCFATQAGREGYPITYGILELSPLTEGSVYGGVFCSGGGGWGAVAGRFVGRVEKAPFEVRKFSSEALRTYLQTHPELAALETALLQQPAAAPVA